MTIEATEATAPETLNEYFYFPTSIYTIMKPEFLDIVTTVSEENLDAVKKEHSLNEIYPVYMTTNYTGDTRLEKFSRFVGETAWNILNSQGHNTTNMMVRLDEMWTQEHYKHSLMEQHAHGHGSQLVGFYFLETPENCSNVIFHDPRPAKVQINLPEANVAEATYSSSMINFQPKPGMLMFTNSWLPHSFGRHATDKPIKFVHFNIRTFYTADSPVCPAPAEVI